MYIVFDDTLHIGNNFDSSIVWYFQLTRIGNLLKIPRTQILNATIKIGPQFLAGATRKLDAVEI